ncbi:MAG TPA: 4-hydroxythreonine-4-phosphate dehydrogenase PdxA, partial [Ignavibacteriaceae bacterium]|nr:4-hydroxythreonine-4-phosphate dehydrogenase PdxA [Ignavibacteriaceae bacterium]
MNKFAFTCGDINGIGPEIVIKSLNRLYKNSKNKFLFICPLNVFENASKVIKPAFGFKIIKEIDRIPDEPGVIVLNIGNFPEKTGQPTKHSGKASFLAIQTAYRLTEIKAVDGIVTPPISKTALKMAEVNFPGHTEMLAGWSGQRDFVMMFLSKKMNAALLTIHESIARAAQLISKELMLKKLKVIEDALIRDLKIPSPKIAVLGLNPHAGEGGLIGNEELEIIHPAIDEFNGESVLSGPHSPDAFFGSGMYKKYDLILGMYHDQVLIPFKMLNFSSGVNYTAGLPFVRTSPDHGTAYDIAGKNKA